MRAPVFTPILKTRSGRCFINSAPSSIAVCGAERSGIQAKDWMSETAFTNEKTSPRLEIPRSIVKTMRIVNPEHVACLDLTIYWYLFGCARHQGIHRQRHAVSLSAIAKFVGIRSIKRILESLERLNATIVRYDFNLGGTRKQQTQMINIADFDRNSPIVGSVLVHYELPEIVRQAVLVSKDYVMLDINALPRLTSKYAVTLFIRLAYIAGQRWEARQDWNVSFRKLADLLSYPTGCFRRLHVVTKVAAALAQINGLSKLHKRFSFEVIAPDEFSEDYTFTIGSSAKRLREVRPADLPDAEYEKISDRTSLPLKNNQYPRITSLRQASTLLGKPTKIISDLWRTDVWGATNYANITCGLDASEFLASIDRYGVEPMFEHWIEKRGFPEFGIVKAPEPEVAPPPTFKPMAKAITVHKVESEYDYDEDLSLAQDFGEMSVSAYEPDCAPAIFDEVDDCKIAF